MNEEARQQWNKNLRVEHALQFLTKKSKNEEPTGEMQWWYWQFDVVVIVVVVV